VVRSPRLQIEGRAQGHKACHILALSRQQHGQRATPRVPNQLELLRARLCQQAIEQAVHLTFDRLTIARLGPPSNWTSRSGQVAQILARPGHVSHPRVRIGNGQLTCRGRFGCRVCGWEGFRPPGRAIPFDVHPELRQRLMRKGLGSSQPAMQMGLCLHGVKVMLAQSGRQSCMRFVPPMRTTGQKGQADKASKSERPLPQSRQHACHTLSESSEFWVQ
jgi:hypothetical protein